jgi:ATP-dependent Clp protease ATP-binding subunit ClpA
LADRLEQVLSGRARTRGWSWQEIAVQLGLSRQALHKKYSREASAPRNAPHRSFSPAFTEGTRRLFIRAQEIARNSGHAFIGTEHLLIAMLEDTTGAIVDALAEQRTEAVAVIAHVQAISGAAVNGDDLLTIGVDVMQVQAAIERQYGTDALRTAAHGRRSDGHLAPTRRVENVLDHATRIAYRFGHPQITPVHITLGIIDDGGGVALIALRRCHVDIYALRASIADGLEDTDADQSQNPEL